ncbi:metallophosphoesterase [Estrella lausannensis]|uniref:Putative metallophosphoesterase n=1 Tax=Estrella lausannensis TaxID=483423 RepID=A0A0H5E6B3_9BACT|nr:metallophosphoesterase [Estrella lausannensis]CRX38815.1 Putative metallophosphoesterase [Estrella lausannensis]
MGKPCTKSLPDYLWDGFCIASVLGIWPRFVEPNLLLTRQLTLECPDLAPELQGLKITQFSDLHFSKSTPDAFLKKLSSKIHRENPDILVFTGDFLCYSHLEDEERLLDFLLSLPQARFGNFAILGNHDYASFVSVGRSGNYSLIGDKENRSSILKGLKRMINPVKPTGIIDPEIKAVKEHRPLLNLLKKTPFNLLENSSVSVRIKDKTLTIHGLGEYTVNKMDESCLSNDKTDFALTLLHNPDGIPRLKRDQYDLILCGHTHGGQVNLPLLRDRFIVMEDERFFYGLREYKGQRVYTTRGVGSVMPFRWFCPPEIVSITLKNKGS